LKPLARIITVVAPVAAPEAAVLPLAEAGVDARDAM